MVRETKETALLVELDLDGPGPVEVETGVPFFDHMLNQLGKHGCLGLTVRAKGDTEIDAHHTVEDTSIALGQALKEALGDKSGIQRFGDALVPLDETLVRAAVDLSGRPYVVHDEPDGMSPMIGTYDTTLTRHIWESLAHSAGICLHVHVLYGRNPHHIVEAQFKAVARALRAAAASDPQVPGHPVHQGRPLTGTTEGGIPNGCLVPPHRPMTRAARPALPPLPAGRRDEPARRRPRLRVGQPPLRRAGPGPGRRATSR